MKNILVTGAAGFIGSNFAEIALQKNYNVVVLDSLTYAGHEANLAFAKGNPALTFIKGNICDGTLVSDLLKKHNINAVFNFAAESHVDNSTSSPAFLTQ